MTAAAAATRQATAPRPWTHYVNDHFFDRPDLEPGLERLALRLERLAREKPWCFTSNDELRHQLGCSQNTLAAILIRGESLGWFRRVLVPGRHGQATGRLGIVLFVRPTDRPVATPETFDQVVDQMRAEIRRGSARYRPRTLPFPAPIPQESATDGPQELGTAVPRNWAPSVPKNWGPALCSKAEEITEQKTETTTTGSESSSSSVFDPGPEPEETGHPGVEALGDDAIPQESVADMSTHLAAPSPAPVATPPAPVVLPVAVEVPAELVAAAAEVIPDASRAWVRSLLRDCGEYGLNLALLVVAWVKIQRAEKPTRYARVALAGWLNQLRSGELTLEDVRGEVHGRPGPRAGSRPFDPAACLARMASSGWELVAVGPDLVKWSEKPGWSACLWKHIPSDVRQQVEEHKAELKAYVLKRAAERGKAVAIRA